MCSTFSLAAKAYMRDSNRKFPPRKYMVIATKWRTPKQIISMPVFPELSIQVIPSVADLQVQDIIQRQSQTCKMAKDDGRRKPGLDLSFVEESYERCRKICEEYAKTYYIGTLLMTEERRKALWAIYAWGRRTDELVHGPNSVYMSSDVLDMWELRLQDIFEGRPHDIIDVALTHIIFRFSLDIKPFRDVIEGMRMDTRKFRYQNFQELYIYSYRVAGTFGLMSVPVLGIAPDSLISAQGVYEGAIHFGTANQLTNILRDVGEDAMLGRVYLPQDELAHFGLSNNDIFARKVTDQWREFMKEQIARARIYFKLAEEGASQLDKASRWPICSALFMYRGILDAIEDNGYDNLTKKAYVRRAKKLLMLPLAYKRSL